jgi:hypothetical protein
VLGAGSLQFTSLLRVMRSVMVLTMRAVIAASLLAGLVDWWTGGLVVLATASVSRDGHGLIKYGIEVY